MTDFDVLIDSDAFVGMFFRKDVHHQVAKEIYERFEKDDARLVTTNFVIAETATVLSRYDGQPLARSFLSFARSGNLPIIFITSTLQEASEKIFTTSENKSTSMVDCSNVAVMKEFHIPAIFSFDKFYFKKHQLQRAA
ncbi:MAG: PIN domain-containing protein [Chloroflexi bacterium]|nr:PIN domain-containing protein [Chloroflexota bacterium]